NSTPNTTYILQVIVGGPCDPTIEGDRFQRSTTISTDANGAVTFQAQIPTSGPFFGGSVTSTATSPLNSTSEISACVPITFSNPNPTPTITPTTTPTSTPTVTPTATSTAAPTPTPTPVDSDGDTWSDEAEATIGTNPLAACGANAWPP